MIMVRFSFTAAAAPTRICILVAPPSTLHLLWSLRMQPEEIQEIQHSSEGAVVIPYDRLISAPNSLQAAIAEGFGSEPSCLGLIIIAGLPNEYTSLREKLLILGDKFASLPESIRERYADAESKFSFGWSHGKEIMNGRPDTLKGSFYANPIVDEPNSTPEQKLEFPEYYSCNIWPRDDNVKDFEETFKSLGRFIYQVGRELAHACQPFAAPFLIDRAISLPDLISPNTTKARLLHYFPPSPSEQPIENEPFDSWCGFHLDHSLLTGLCSAMYLSHEKDGESKIRREASPQSGLYVRTRGGSLIKVSIPSNCLAFQIGETLELVTNGRLRATPHCVRVENNLGAEYISRETFALFMQPDTNIQISPEETFGNFSKRVLSEHYNK